MAYVSLNTVKHLAAGSGLREPSAPLPTGGILYVRHPSSEDILSIYEMSRIEISCSVAPLDLVKAVYGHNPDTFWGVYFSHDNARDRARLIGYYSFLHLNAAGALALENGTFDGLNLDFSQLVGEGGTPAVIYVWALVARKVARIATVLVAKALGRDRYGGVPIYGRAATLGGVSSLKSYGFEGIRPCEKGLGDLFRLDPEVPQAAQSVA
ncbi:MAG TPA: hypothetical protein VII49_08035 [Rhizomicrobium sp.]